MTGKFLRRRRRGRATRTCAPCWSSTTAPRSATPTAPVRHLARARGRRRSCRSSSTRASAPSRWTTTSTRRVLASAVRGPAGGGQGALLDQRLIAGVGNIYADEALWRREVHPLTPAGRCARADARPARRGHPRGARGGASTAQGSTHAATSARPTASYGSMQERFQVYGRTASRACAAARRSCAAASSAGRGTHFCPRCQRRRRVAWSGGLSHRPLHRRRQRRTGCTVHPAAARLHRLVRGARRWRPARARRRCWRPRRRSTGVDAILLTGGSAFGLAAADGVRRGAGRAGHSASPRRAGRCRSCRRP